MAGWQSAPETPAANTPRWAQAPIVQHHSEAGAPMAVRAAVGAAPTPEDRIRTMEKFYPDVIDLGDGQFSFTDPATGRPTLYNPPGLDAGDFVSIGGDIAEFGGGVVGAAAATPPAVAGAPPTLGTSLLAIPVAAGLGAAAGREAYTGLANQMFGTVDNRSMGHRLTDVAATAVGNMAGQMGGDALAAGAKAAFGGAARGTLSSLRAPGMLADYDTLGLTPRLPGAVSGNRTMQTIEQGLSSAPGSASAIQRVVGETTDAVQAAADKVASRYASASGSPQRIARTQQELGDMMQGVSTNPVGARASSAQLALPGPGGSGATPMAKTGTGARGAIDRFTVRSDQLYNNVYAQLPPDTMAQPQSVIDLARQIGAVVQQAPESLSGPARATAERIAALVRDAEQGGGIPFEALRQIRTDLGKDLGDPLSFGQTKSSRQYLQRLYGALTDDMNRTVMQASPQAARDLAVADRYYRFNMGQNIPLLNKVIDSGTPEHAYRIALSGAKDGGSQLQALRRNLTPEEWDIVAGSTIARLGLPNAGARGANEVGEAVGDFSIAQFMTNLGNLSPEAQRALFSGNRYQEVLPQLKALNRIVGGLKESGRLANNSNTARALGVMGLIGAGTQATLNGDPHGAAYGLAAGILAPRVAARLITNPNFVRWLSSTAQATSTNSWPAQVGRLFAVGEANPEIRDEIGQYYDAIRVAPQERPPAQPVQPPA